MTLVFFEISFDPLVKDILKATKQAQASIKTQMLIILLNKFVWISNGKINSGGSVKQLIRIINDWNLFETDSLSL